MSALSPALVLADLARGDLASLLAFLSGQGTSGASLAAQLDARLDTERQDTLLTWAARHGQAEAVRLLPKAGRLTAMALPLSSSHALGATPSAPGCSSRPARRSAKLLMAASRRCTLRPSTASTSASGCF